MGLEFKLVLDANVRMRLTEAGRDRVVMGADRLVREKPELATLFERLSEGECEMPVWVFLHIFGGVLVNDPSVLDHWIIGGVVQVEISPLEKVFPPERLLRL